MDVVQRTEEYFSYEGIMWKRTMKSVKSQRNYVSRYKLNCNDCDWQSAIVVAGGLAHVGQGRSEAVNAETQQRHLQIYSFWQPIFNLIAFKTMVLRGLEASLDQRFRATTWCISTCNRTIPQQSR